MDAQTATVVTAGASAVYAVVAALSLLLPSRQIRDARRFGAAPALYALLKDLEEHMAALRRVGSCAEDDPAGRDTITRHLDFVERVEHLRVAGVLPADVPRRAFGPVLSAQLADPRFRRIIEADVDRHAEVLSLARRLVRGRRAGTSATDQRRAVAVARGMRNRSASKPP